MTDNYKIPELELPIPETLTFRYQGKNFSGNTILILFKIILAIIIVVLVIIPEQPSILRIDNQSLSPRYSTLFFVIMWVFLGLLVFEIGRDINVSRFSKYVDWDSIKFTQNGISLAFHGQSEKICC